MPQSGRTHKILETLQVAVFEEFRQIDLVERLGGVVFGPVEPPLLAVRQNPPVDPLGRVFEVVLDLVGRVAIGSLLAEPLGEVRAVLLGFQYRSGSAIHPFDVTIALLPRCFATRVGRIEQQSIVVPAPARECRLLERVETEHIQHFVNPRAQQFVLLVRRKEIAFGFPQLPERFEGFLRFLVAIPLLQVANTFVQIVPGEETRIQIWRLAKRRLTHIK